MSARHVVISALEEIANYVDLSDGNKFKAIAYRRAARSLEGVGGDFRALLASGALLETPGIGKGIAPVVTELVETGRSSYLESLRAQYPSGIFELLRVPALGLKKIGVLYKELGVSNLADLEAACATQKLRKLPGFGKKTEEKICEALEEIKRAPSRFLLPRMLEAAQRIVATLEALPSVARVEIAGSLRRKLETVGDIDLVAVSSKPQRATDEIAACDLLQVTAQEPTTVRARFRGEIPVEIHVASKANAELVMFHLTGSREFVSVVVDRAKSKGVDLTLEGGFRASSEDEVFRAAGMTVVPPELREAPRRGRSRLPRLVELEDLRGAFHIHTTYSDGRATVHEMLEAAADLEWEYAGISDHSKTAAYAGGLTEDRLAIQQREIDETRASFESLRVFKGSEVDILADGSLDYAPRTLATFDFVVASVHSRFKMQSDEMTDRIVRALANPFVTFLGHLTGRLLLSRPGYALDFDRVFEAAATGGVMIEINANPHRLDIDWRLMRKALDAGVIFCINPDAHSTDEMRHLQAGVWHARKGGLEPKHIFNTLPADEVASYLAARRSRAMKWAKLG